MSMSWESYHDLRDSDGPPEYAPDEVVMYPPGSPNPDDDPPEPRHPDAYEYGEPWGPGNPAPGSPWARNLPEPATLFDAGFGGQDITVYPDDECPHGYPAADANSCPRCTAAARMRCIHCGLTANVEPGIHAERYGHEPAVWQDGEVWVFDYTRYIFVQVRPLPGHPVLEGAGYDCHCGACLSQHGYQPRSTEGR